MTLFQKRKYTDINDAVAHADSCKSLSLMCAENLVNRGQDFLQLVHLKELHIQGDQVIYDDYSFELPTELGQLKHLQKLTLLNLPLKSFPTWIMNLSNLSSLMVRGTDVTFIPEEIKSLSKLKTLRVENCNLQILPAGLSEMRQLKYLGLCDTRLKQIKASMFPSHLKTLDFSGTGVYDLDDLQKLRLNLKRTHMRPILN